jgi:hypothetical protein
MSYRHPASVKSCRHIYIIGDIHLSHNRVCSSFRVAFSSNNKLTTYTKLMDHQTYRLRIMGHFCCPPHTRHPLAGFLLPTDLTSVATYQLIYHPFPRNDSTSQIYDIWVLAKRPVHIMPSTSPANCYLLAPTFLSNPSTWILYGWYPQ